MAIAPEYFKREKIGRNKTAYYFDTLMDYERFIDEVQPLATGNTRTGLDRITRPNYIQNNATNSSWYGTNDASLVSGNLTTYLFNNELDSFLGSVRSRTVQVDITDLDQQKAIKFTEKEVGIFSFDLASLGLIRVFEFYSPLLKRIVSGNLVKSETLGNGKKAFYYVGTPEIKEHFVTWNIKEGAYFSNVLKRIVDVKELIKIDDLQYVYPQKDAIPRHEVERRQVLDKEGRKKFATTFKKCFIEIPKVEKPLPRIDIIVGSSFSSDVNAQTEMIYSSMAAISLAEKLTASSVNYRIIVCYPVKTSNGNNEVYSFVNVKKEGEVLDKNKIAILLSDARQFRYKQFKGFFATQFDAGYDANISPTGIGKALEDKFITYQKNNNKYGLVELDDAFDTNNDIKYYRDMEFDNEQDAENYINNSGRGYANRIRNAYIDLLANSNIPADVEASKNKKSKIVFSGATSLREATNQYNLVINQIKRL